MEQIDSKDDKRDGDKATTDTRVVFRPTPKTNVSSEDITTVGERMATPFGVGQVKEMRDDGFVVVKLGWGQGIFHRSCLRQNTLKMLVHEMEQLMMRGSLCVAERQMEQAIVCYERALKMAPFAMHEKAEVRQLVAQITSHEAYCFLTLEKYEKGMELCDAALRYDPSDYKAVYRMGQIHARLGNYAEADEALHKALEHLPEMEREIKAEIDINQDRKKQIDAISKRIFTGELGADEGIAPREKVRRTTKDDIAKTIKDEEAGVAPSDHLIPSYKDKSDDLLDTSSDSQGVLSQLKSAISKPVSVPLWTFGLGVLTLSTIAFAMLPGPLRRRR